ncbi:MAG: G-D-S-L family lipolytic protein [Saprospiraceae bacterium]|nr:G-D-S-L family lipolytic protein [Saprospiraceae bacterium]
MKPLYFYTSLVLNLILLGSLAFALHKYGGLRNLWAKINSRGIEKTYFHRKNLFEMLPPKEGAIVMLGNSITAGGEWPELLDNPNVINRGIPGDHCDGMRERLNEVLRHRPTKLFLMAGVNDLAFLPPAKVWPKYERLVNEILTKSPDTKLYLQSVLPVNNIVSPTAVDNEDVEVLNVKIKALAEAKGLVFLDVNSVLKDLDGNLDAAYTLDGVHINGAAYLKWAAEIKKVM